MQTMRAMLVIACAIGWAGEVRANCEVTVEGAVQASGKSPGGPTELTTDYWMTDAELRTALRAMLKITKKGADIDKEVEAAMKRDPRIMTFLFNCMAGDVRMNFVPGPDSGYKDVPFGPKKYTLAKGFRAKRGEMGVMVTVNKASFGRTEGHLDITKFDATGISGTFALTATSHAKADDKITVKGKFSYPCHVETEVCRAGKKK